MKLYTFVEKFKIMVHELKEGDSLDALLEKITGKKREKDEKTGKKTLADIYGKLKRGLDGLEYQRACRYGED